MAWVRAPEGFQNQQASVISRAYIGPPNRSLDTTPLQRHPGNFSLCTSLTQTHSVVNMSDQATAQSAFFRVLPPEVRIAILTAAFGCETVHIQPCEAAERQAQAQESRPRGPVGAARNWLRGLVADRTWRRKGAARPDPHPVRWCGRICACTPRKQPLKSPTEDHCLEILKQHALERNCPCASEPEFAVGATGWLLTCRRA